MLLEGRKPRLVDCQDPIIFVTHSLGGIITKNVRYSAVVELDRSWC